MMNPFGDSRRPPVARTGGDTSTIEDAAGSAGSGGSEVIRSLLLQPSDLDSVLAQRKSQTESEKTSVDVMIHTMMEGHLQNIGASMTKIANARQAVQQIKHDFEQVFAKLDGTEAIKKRLARLREEFGKYRQYRTALEVSAHLMNVPGL